MGDTPARCSIFFDHRLVAYAWDIEAPPGAIEEGYIIAGPVVLRCFDTKRRDALDALAREAKTFDSFLFKLRLDEFDVREGEVGPSHVQRRF